MIALIGIGAPFNAGVVAELSELPRPPAEAFTSFLVKCSRNLSVPAVLQWHEQVVRGRPSVVLGMVLSPTPEDMIRLAAHPYVIKPVLLEGASDGTAPLSALRELRFDSVRGQIVGSLAETLRTRGPEDRRLVRAFVDRGVDGGTVSSVARQLDVSRQTVNNHLKKLTACTPKCLLTSIRLTSVALRRNSGEAKRSACKAAAFSTCKAYSTSLMRHKGRTADCARQTDGCPWRDMFL